VLAWYRFDTKTTKAFYEIGCDDKAFVLFLSFKKELSVRSVSNRYQPITELGKEKN